MKIARIVNRNTLAHGAAVGLLVLLNSILPVDNGTEFGLWEGLIFILPYLLLRYQSRGSPMKILPRHRNAADPSAKNKDDKTPWNHLEHNENIKITTAYWLLKDRSK